MIQYFQEGFRSLVQIKMEQRSQELDSFEEIVKKAVDAKTKAALRARSYAHNTNQHCLQGSWPSATKTIIQGQPMKDPRVDKSKLKS